MVRIFKACILAITIPMVVDAKMHGVLLVLLFEKVVGILRRDDVGDK